MSSSKPLENDFFLSGEHKKKVLNTRIARMQSAIKQEEAVTLFIPYQSHVTEHIIKTHNNEDYVLTLKLQGAAHESADIEDLNAWKNQLNGFLRNIADPEIAVWTHTVRRKYDQYPQGHFNNDFAHNLNEKYKAYMLENELFVNELYLSIVYRPNPSKAESFLQKASKAFGFISDDDLVEQQQEAIDRLNECADTAMQAMARYEPRKLGFYTFNDHLFSEPLQLYSFLIDGEWHRFPVPRRDIDEILGTSRPFAAQAGSLSFKTPTGSHHAAVLAIEEYPNPTSSGILNDLLSLPYSYVLTQSMTFISKQPAKGRMTRQKDRLVAAGDVAISQTLEIEQGLDDLISNQFVMGTHHLSLVIRADDVKTMTSAITASGSILSDAGMKWVREDTSALAAIYAQLPANFNLRPRPSDINSLNFAAFAGFHNFPVGRIRNNQWGEAVMMFKTTSRSPYFFNFHQTEVINNKIDPNHKDLANTMIIGSSGGGKTVLEMMLLSQAVKFDEPNNPATFILFDKGFGCSVGVRALGGKYFPISNKVPTGFAPMKMESTPSNISFLNSFIKKLVYRPEMPLTPQQEREISEGIEMIMNMPGHKRSLSAFLEYTDQTDASGVGERLSKWCKGGEHGWLFDNDEDNFSLEGSNIFGFDVTDFIDNDEINTPTTMYLFHKIESLIDGRRLAIFLDEFWKLLQDPYFEDLVENKLKTIRKENGFIVPITQSPQDALKSKISHSLIEQTATMIFLPNAKADRADYVEGFKLTHREFELIKDFDEKSRKCLIKQGQNSVVAELNLKGFDDELAVLSGNTATSLLCERLVAELGDDPAVWLPEFHKQRKG